MERMGWKLSGPRLERRNAKKSISYDSAGSNHRRTPRHGGRDGDESDSSNHSREDWSVDEFSVHGREGVEEMSNMFRSWGLPGPAHYGIERDAWEGVKLSPSPSGIGDGRRRSTDGSFISTSSPDGNQLSVPATPSRLSPVFVSPLDATQQAVFGIAPSPHHQSSLRTIGRAEVAPGKALNATLAEATPQPTRDHNGRVKRPSRDFSNVVRDAVAEDHKNKEDAAAVSSFIETHRVEGLSRTDSLPNCEPFSQDSRSQRHSTMNLKASSNGDRIERALSEPVDMPSLSMGRTSNFREKDITSRDVNGYRKQPSTPKPQLDNPITGQIFMKRDGQAGNHLKTEESSRRDNNQASSSNAPQGDQLPSAVPGIDHRPGIIHQANTSQSLLRGSLKLPPPLTVLKMPEESSTQDIFNSLGPDDSEVTSRVSSDDEERLSSEEDKAERDSLAEEERESSSESTVEGGHVSTGSQASEQSPVPAVVLQETDNVVTVQVLDQEPQIMNLSSIGQNPDSELRDSARPSDHPVGPKMPWLKGPLLGSGSFGSVYQAVDSDGMFFAVKEVSLVERDNQAQQSISQLMQEIELLSQFKHDNIVQYLGTEKADGRLYIFLELASKGSLASILKEVELPHSVISAYTKQILRGLKFLHDQNIVHRDIKCANILVDVSGKCKLADFGMAKQISSLDQTKSCKGSAYWMAPEVIDPKKTYGNPADIWSLGCSVLEMATGSPPFGDMEWYRVLWTVGHGNAPPIPDYLSDSAKDFVKRCLEINPMKRPTATALLDHPFVRQAGGPKSNSVQLNIPTVISNLQPIAEERSADLTNDSFMSLQESETLLVGIASEDGV